MNYQVLWLVLLVAFAVIEGVTAGLVSIWFCAGSLAALIATWLGASLLVQIGLFVVVSLVAMAIIRPMARPRRRGRRDPRRDPGPGGTGRRRQSHRFGP